MDAQIKIINKPVDVHMLITSEGEQVLFELFVSNSSAFRVLRFANISPDCEHVSRVTG